MGLVRLMKESQSSLDVTASVRELQAVVGGHIDKVYHPTLDHLVLAIRLPGEGKSYVHFWIGKWLYRSEKSQDMPATFGLRDDAKEEDIQCEDPRDQTAGF
jgi:predicted ribosome quality control (RQC) complex YloA/Tae2 family protein